MNKSVVQEIASAFEAWRNSVISHNMDWAGRHKETVNKLTEQKLPHGGGFDSGTKFVWENSRPDYLVFKTEFHHMNEAGFYTHWTTHLVSVRPSFVGGMKIVITGPDDNDVKELIHEAFDISLSAELREGHA